MIILPTKYLTSSDSPGTLQIHRIKVSTSNLSDAAEFKIFRAMIAFSWSRISHEITHGNTSKPILVATAPRLHCRRHNYLPVFAHYLRTNVEFGIQDSVKEIHFNLFTLQTRGDKESKCISLDFIGEPVHDCWLTAVDCS